MNTIKVPEKQRAIDVRQVVRDRSRAGVDVVDQDGAGGGAVALARARAPCTPSLAPKNSVPLTFVRSAGFEFALPGLMSLTRTVPAAVPLLFHSSEPCVPSLAAKNSVPLTFVRYDRIRSRRCRG